MKVFKFNNKYYIYKNNKYKTFKGRIWKPLLTTDVFEKEITKLCL